MGEGNSEGVGVGLVGGDSTVGVGERGVRGVSKASRDRVGGARRGGKGVGGAS